MPIQFSDSSHRRYNPLTGDWILLSPQRMARPWTGQTDSIVEEEIPSHDSACYLCPGNTRQGGEVNPRYSGTYVFPNDYPALLRMSRTENVGDLFQAQEATGHCEVLCYTPDHNRSLMHMTQAEIVRVIELWQARFKEIGDRPDVAHVQIFESRGKEVGNSNLHPHCQIWAQNSVPSFVATEVEHQEEYFDNHHSRMLLDYLNQELEQGDRIVLKNDSFVVVVPFWAGWPYETLIMPRRSMESVLDLNDSEKADFAHVLSKMTNAYAQLFRRPQYGAAYMLGLHQRPTDEHEYPGFQFHAHFSVPGLTPERLKYRAGYEEFAELQRDITPERAAQDLRQYVLQ